MFKRHLENQAVTRYKLARSLYIFGPRQSGKTTLSRIAFPELPYVCLEDPDTLEFVNSDPRGFFNQFDNGAIIDEPQRSSELFSYLQGQIDNANKKFVLTSSQNFLMMESISQSLAGRISILNLMPLSRGELLNQPLTPIDNLFKKNYNHAVKSSNKINTINSLWQYIITGGYPEVNNIPEASNYWFNDYVKTYLEKDVRKIINVQDLSLFQRFIKLCAGRSGSILNKASLAQDCGISESSCTRWLSLLEQSGIIILLKPYYNNFNKRQTKSNKIIFVDTGLCCNLLGIKTVAHLSTHPLLGAIVETYIISELYKVFLNNGEDPAFYYWRDQHGNEVDLIIDMPDGNLLPIEIKAAQTVTTKMLEPIYKWLKLANINQGVVLYGGNEIQQRSDLSILPISLIY